MESTYASETAAEYAGAEPEVVVEEPAAAPALIFLATSDEDSAACEIDGTCL